MEDLRLNDDPTPIAPPTFPTTLTPAPVTVVRTPGPPQPTDEQKPPRTNTASPFQTQVINTGIMSNRPQQLDGNVQHQPLSSGGGPQVTPYRMTNTQFSSSATSATIPAQLPPQSRLTPQQINVPSTITSAETLLQPYSISSLLPKAVEVHSPPSQTVSGLPSVPPTISFPTIPPKISLTSPGIHPPPPAATTTS